MHAYSIPAILLALALMALMRASVRNAVNRVGDGLRDLLKVR